MSIYSVLNGKMRRFGAEAKAVLQFYGDTCSDDW